jgi:hypothetical protein
VAYPIPGPDPMLRNVFMVFTSQVSVFIILRHEGSCAMG